jgi:16S rRNA processing protein RimM
VANDAERSTDETATSPGDGVGQAVESAQPTPAASDKTRSDGATADDYLIVARVLRAHGVRGEVACEIITEFPERFQRTNRVFLTPASRTNWLEPLDGATPQPYAVTGTRLVQYRGHAEVVIDFEGVADRDDAEALRGHLIQVPRREAWKLPRGRFYWHQIIGLKVVSTDGEEIGKVTDILETGANDVYVVKGAGPERLIPAVKEYVKSIAPERGEMVVSLLPGM